MTFKLFDGSHYPSIPSLCFCGCNNIVWGGKQFSSGHNSKINNPNLDNHKLKGVPKSELHKQHLKESWTKERRNFTEEHCKNISISNLETFLLRPDGTKEIYPFIPITCQCKDIYCNEICWDGREYVSGHNLIGIIQSEESKKKRSESQLGIKHWNFGGISPRKGIPTSIEGRKIISDLAKLRVKELNHNWKGGLTPLYEQIRMCNKYNEWRISIFERDSFSCQECNSKKDIEAHHINRFIDICREFNIVTLEESLNCVPLWDINNGITLCEECHNETKGREKDFVDLYKSILNNQ
jgi:hypothetical protein